MRGSLVELQVALVAVARMFGHDTIIPRMGRDGGG